jgi:hypothetical protein
MGDSGFEFNIGTAALGIRVRVLGRTHPECHDFWDGNWILCEATVAVGGFRGRVQGCLRTEEIESFRDQLKSMYQTVSGRAEFRTLEGWLSLKLAAEKTGKVECRGEMLDDPGIGNRLEFTLDLDQTYIAPVLIALDSIATAFPVVGKP